jgi:hypothetical protein
VSKVSALTRVSTAASLLAGLGRHDLRAASTFVAMIQPPCSDRGLPPGAGLLRRWTGFLAWALKQMFEVIPEAMTGVTFARPVVRTSIWLADENPSVGEDKGLLLANHPWRSDPDARLPEQAEVVVIGAGFTGAACAYHWAGAARQKMVVLEMNDPASGASGHCEGLVVMGRYYALVLGTVRSYLDRVRADLAPDLRDRLAAHFAAAYAHSAYKNAELIAQTIVSEGYDCDYARHGWIQARDAEDQAALAESVRLAQATGFDESAGRGADSGRHQAGLARRFLQACGSLPPGEMGLVFARHSAAVGVGRVVHPYGGTSR